MYVHLLAPPLTRLEGDHLPELAHAGDNVQFVVQHVKCSNQVTPLDQFTQVATLGV